MFELGFLLPTDTRDQILDTAERLFAEFGIDGVSIRTITAEAQVNLAAIHYHFGSKEALVREVFVRRIGPVNRERLRLLDDLLERSRPEKPRLEELVRILVGPPLRLWLQAEKGETFSRLCGRIYSETSGQLQTMFVDLFRGGGPAFLGGIRAGGARSSEAGTHVAHALRHRSHGPHPDARRVRSAVGGSIG